MKKILISIFILCAFFIAKAQNPNVIFFVVDDMGWKDLQFQGSQVYETPEVDQLRNEGVFLRNSYVAHARCTGSRWAMASGRYPARVGIPGNMADSIRKDYVSVAESFKENDYTTGFFGKWHHMGDLILDHGFDVNVGGNDQDGGTGSHFFPYGLNNGLEVGTTGEELADRLTNDAIDFIKNNKDTNFFVFLSHFAVHTPIETDSTTEAYFQNKIDNITFTGPATISESWGDAISKGYQDNPRYAGLIKGIDKSLGTLRDSLKAMGLDSNTVIVFTSDHGGLSTTGINNNRELATSNLPLRGGKGHVYEGGTRVPTIVVWPGQVSPNTTSLARVTGTDFYPTMLDLAGLPTYPDRHLDGESFKWAVMGNSNPDPDRAIYWHNIKNRLNSTGDTNATAVVQGKYKLIDFFDAGITELYDLDVDEEEQINLSNTYPEIRDSLLKMVRQWQCSVGAQDVPAPAEACGDFVEGTFEYCLNGWTASDDHNGTYLGPIGLTDSISYQENHSVRVVNQVQHNWKHRLDSDCRFNLIGGQLYNINFHALHEAANGEIRFTLQDSANVALHNKVFSIDSADWKHFSYDYTPITNQPNCRLRISFRKLGAYNFDNVKFITLDCNNEFGGTAFIDSCSTCVEGSTGISACTLDCNNDWGGTAYLDSCSTCVEGNTSNTACIKDCYGDWGGSAYLDSCGTCIGTGDTACIQDCNNEWGGSALLDSCNICVEGTTGLSACVQDCNNEWGGTAFVDSCGVCADGNTGITSILDSSLCNVGIDNKLNQVVKIFPNPSSGNFTLTTKNKTLNVELVSNIGRVIKRFKVEGSYTFGDELKPGVYFVKIKDGERNVTLKVIKFDY